MNEPTYLYGHGTKRHIIDPDGRDAWRKRLPALCGVWGEDDQEMTAHQRRLYGAIFAERRIQRNREAPVCKSCQKLWDRRQS